MYYLWDGYPGKFPEDTHIIYFVQRLSDSLIKIGTTSHPRQRLDTLTREFGQIFVHGYMYGGHDTEKRLHCRFAELRVEGEWFKPAHELRVFINANSIIDFASHQREFCFPLSKEEWDEVIELGLELND